MSCISTGGHDRSLLLAMATADYIPVRRISGSKSCGGVPYKRGMHCRLCFVRLPAPHQFSFSHTWQHLSSGECSGLRGGDVHTFLSAIKSADAKTWATANAKKQLDGTWQDGSAPQSKSAAEPRGRDISMGAGPVVATAIAKRTNRGSDRGLLHGGRGMDNPAMLSQVNDTYHDDGDDDFEDFEEIFGGLRDSRVAHSEPEAGAGAINDAAVFSESAAQAAMADGERREPAAAMRTDHPNVAVRHGTRAESAHAPETHQSRRDELPQAVPAAQRVSHQYLPTPSSSMSPPVQLQSQSQPQCRPEPTRSLVLQPSLLPFRETLLAAGVSCEEDVLALREWIFTRADLEAFLADLQMVKSGRRAG